MQLSQEQVRAVHLAAQGLLSPPTHSATKSDVLAVIRRMNSLQIDTIHVIARSPYLVLWSRLGAYETRWLDELLAEGALFEYWSHAACFLPIEDYGLYRRRMLHDAHHSRAWIASHREETERVLGYIRENGPSMARHFQRTDGKKGGTWWDWKPEKIALECLFNTGKLMIARRENFQRVYDLQERVLPGWDDENVPTEHHIRKTFAARSVRALGVARARWVPGYFYMSKVGMPAILGELVRDEEIVEVEVEGWKEPGYAHRDSMRLLEQARSGQLKPEMTTLLSPFDPVAWDRNRLSNLFGFEYKIETYTPSHQRKYGYFTLPILHRGAIVGRLDPKAHRKEGIFEVRALHLEPGVEVTEQLVRDLAAALQSCASWHGTPKVVISQSDPADVAPQLQEVLADSQRELKAVVKAKG